MTVGVGEGNEERRGIFKNKELKKKKKKEERKKEQSDSF